MSDPTWVRFDTNRVAGTDVWTFLHEGLTLTVSVKAGTPLSEVRAAVRDGIERVKSGISCERSQ